MKRHVVMASIGCTLSVAGGAMMLFAILRVVGAWGGAGDASAGAVEDAGEVSHPLVPSGDMLDRALDAMWLIGIGGAVAAIGATLTLMSYRRYRSDRLATRGDRTSHPRVEPLRASGGNGGASLGRDGER